MEKTDQCLSPAHPDVLVKQNSGSSINIPATFAEIVSNCPLMESAADNGQLVYLDQPATAIPISTTVTSVPDVSWTLLTWQPSLHAKTPVCSPLQPRSQSRTGSKAIDDLQHTMEVIPPCLTVWSMTKPQPVSAPSRPNVTIKMQPTNR